MAHIFKDVLDCLIRIISGFIPSLLLAVILHFTVKIKPFIFRKLIHLIAFSCITIMIYYADSWISLVISSIILILIIYPILTLLEKSKYYTSLFVEKEPGEIKQSMILYFLVVILITLISWGIFKRKDFTYVAMLIWGFGDASAALIGVPFGKHKIGNKSLEGSLAMFIVSFLTCIVFLHQSYSGIDLLIISVIASFIATITELFSSSKYDTFTVPFACILIMLIISRFI